MRLFNIWRLLLPIIIVSPLAAVSSQQPQETEGARGAFMVTRKNPGGSKPEAQPPKSARQTGSGRKQSGAGKDKQTAGPNTDVAKQTGGQPAGGQQSTDSDPMTPEPGAIGLGYTLYQRVAASEPARVSASQPFYEDDQVRFVIEPNTDGYLYIFYTENDGEPEMIFPDHRLSQGANQVKAHVPYEAPSRNTPIKWFTFTENKPARLRLFIVVSRQPLPNVPAGQELVAYCKSSGDECVWKPSPELFDPVLAAASEKKLTHKKEAPRQVLASTESEAITRGIKLKPEAPEPDIVYLNASAKSGVLAVSAVLNQRPRP
jgi:hypothetical protein